MKRISELLQIPDLSDQDWAKRDREITEQRNAEIAADLRRNRDLRRSELIAAGVPERRIDDACAFLFKQTPATKALEGFDSDERTIRILAGGVGCGKTVAAVEWLFRCGGRAPRFMRAAGFEAAGRYDREFREGWLKATAIVLDDLGSEYSDGKGNLAADLDELFDVYSGRRSRLVITTNLPPDKFSKRYGARIVSRLRLHSRWKNVTGKDMRRK